MAIPIAFFLSEHPALTTVALVVGAGLLLLLLPGCAVNGVPMRSAPGASPEKSWFIKGKPPGGVPVSCSFVEFDERGDFLDFNQHRDCQKQIKLLVETDPVLLVIYCHGWKNNSQSGEVVEFNAFLTKLAASEEIVAQKLRVHGVYLGWKGNNFLPYVEKRGRRGTISKRPRHSAGRSLPTNTPGRAGGRP